MSTPDIHGYAAKSAGQRLEPVVYTPPDLKPDDVRVDVTHCGICHTDIHAIDDYYGITTFPFVPGHEIVGHVTDLGSSVVDLRAGDRVGVGWQARSCGECEWCRRGETQLCMAIEDTTVMVPYGGFSSSVIADHRFVYPIPHTMLSENAAVLMCAGLAVYGALRRHVEGSATRAAVLGVGGLGHLAIQFASAMGCEVTAISSSPEKEEQARAFGADRFIDCNDRDAMKRVDYAFDVLICTATQAANWSGMLMTLRKRGTLVLVGFPDLALNSTNLVAHDLSITGSLLGNPPMMREMLSFVEAHSITPVVELMPMSVVNEAIEKVKQNRARYRIVLFAETAPGGA